MTDSVIEKSASPDAQTSTDGSLFGYALFALGLAIAIRLFVATPFIVSGASMEATFQNYDYLIIDRITYRLSDPQRGDVVVFGLPQETSRDLIKRVIGLPGETVVLENGKVKIINAAKPDGFVLSEPYLSPENLGGASDMRVTLGQDQYFVLGDNRRVSADSRLWGTLPRNDMVGRVLVRLYPFPAISFLPGEARY
jgi:signal peptidase I